MRDVAAFQHDSAGRRIEDAADQIEDGRFARAVGSDDPENLRLGETERDAVDGTDAAEIDIDAIDREQRHTSRSDFA